METKKKKEKQLINFYDVTYLDGFRELWLRLPPPFYITHIRGSQHHCNATDAILTNLENGRKKRKLASPSDTWSMVCGLTFSAANPTTAWLPMVRVLEPELIQ